MINRLKQFEKRFDASFELPKKDIAIQKVQMIDDNGEIQTEEKQVIIDEAEMIGKIPAYTTKIEYQQQYGTLDKNNIVKYSFARGNMHEEDVLKLRNEIIKNGIAEMKIKKENNEVLTEEKTE